MSLLVILWGSLVLGRSLSPLPPVGALASVERATAAPCVSLMFVVTASRGRLSIRCVGALVLRGCLSVPLEFVCAWRPAARAECVVRSHGGVEGETGLVVVFSVPGEGLLLELRAITSLHETLQLSHLLKLLACRE